MLVRYQLSIGMLDTNTRLVVCRFIFYSLPVRCLYSSLSLYREVKSVPFCGFLNRLLADVKACFETCPTTRFPKRLQKLFMVVVDIIHLTYKFACVDELEGNDSIIEICNYEK